MIVDDEIDMCKILSFVFRKEGINVLIANDGNTALQMIRSEIPDIVIMDVRMPGMDGMEALRRAKAISQDLPIIMITAHADVDGAIQAMKSGADNYISKPFNNRELIELVRKLLADRGFSGEEMGKPRQNKVIESLREKMGPSDTISRLLSEVKCVAESGFTVVIQGESGSGKELVAQAIHQASHRSKAPFVPVDSGAIPDTLLESELFGYERGAFTGASHQKQGKIEVSNHGTLFLDEISNMPLGSQAKLLRVLQEKKVCRIGGRRPLDVDIRLLVATNQDLNKLAGSGSFRHDLFFRLNEFTIKIPPLRDRKEDIPYLSQRFLDITNKELNKNVKNFSKSALEGLLMYGWPGNVRQLRATIRRAVLLADETITEEHLDIEKSATSASALVAGVHEVRCEGLSLREVVRRTTSMVERKIIIEVLNHTGGNKAKAARELQIDYKTMHTKMKQLGISVNGGKCK
jgi:two-component system nitrogen regulation response regulator GlnG